MTVPDGDAVSRLDERPKVRHWVPWVRPGFVSAALLIGWPEQSFWRYFIAAMLLNAAMVIGESRV